VAIDFQQALIDPEPFITTRCMCGGSMIINFYKNNDRMSWISNIHGKSIRTSLGDSDIKIKNIPKWSKWFENHGIDTIKNEIEESRIASNKNSQDKERWVSAMPSGFLKFWEQAVDYNMGTENIPVLAARIQELLPQKNKQILALLKLYGSGDGPWSGYPSYEGAIGELLIKYNMKEIQRAIDSTTLDKAQLEGFSRLICSYSFVKKYGEFKEVPKKLNDQILKYLKPVANIDELDAYEKYSLYIERTK
jgi:hypothetical protein